MPTEAKLKQLLQDLSAPFPPESIERTDGRATGKGFSTTGIKVAYIVMRLNQCVGLGGWRLHRELKISEITNQSGRKAWSAVADVVLELVEWVNGTAVTYAEVVADGGHVSYSSEADARKGATSNGLKKAASMLGCGWQAFAGTIDDDNVPGEGESTAQPTMTVVRAPAAQAQHQRPPEQTPPGYIRTSTAAEVRQQVPEKGRLSSRQLAAIWSIARKLGIEQSTFRSRVKATYSTQLEFLNRQQASELITTLNAQLNGNGHAQDDAQPPQGAA